MTERRIQIRCPEERLRVNEENRRRLEACRSFLPTDRTPVLFSIALRYLFWARGVEAGDYFENPRTQLEQQLLNQKWLIEHMMDDRYIDELQITVAPDLQNIRGGYFNIGVRWFQGMDPVAVPILEQPSDIEALEVPGVHENLYGMKIEWYHAMKEMAPEYEVTLNGKPLEINVTVAAGGGPFPDAYALARDKLFIWVYEAPQLVHILMHKVTTAFINYNRYTRELTGAPLQHLSMGCDAAEMLSEEMFREFVLPYYLQCYEAFPGNRGLHMCGKIDHLLRLLAEEMKITHLNGFGCVTDPRALAETMGGRVVMSGGIDPVLLLNGPKEQIKQECFKYMGIFSPVGGYILQDGNNVAPGTSLANLATVIEAAEEFG